MAKFKTMWLPDVRRVHVWRVPLTITHQAVNRVPNRQVEEKIITISAPDAEQRSAETVKQEVVTQQAVKEEVAREIAKQDASKQEASKQDGLLLKEMDETNNWARLGAQLYFGWFTLMLTINGVAMSWLFGNRGAIPRFASLLFIVFVLLNLMGTIVTILLSKHMLESDRRIKEVLTRLTQNHATEGVNFEPQSPMPRQAIKTVFVFTGAALFMLLLLWMVLAIWSKDLLA